MDIHVQFIPTAKMSRADWLAARKRGIGGSDAGAILGICPWKTAVDVWLEKTNKVEAADEDRISLRLGSYLEDFVAKEYTAETGREVRRFQFLVKRGPLLGNVDRLVFPEDGSLPAFKRQVRTDRLLECKTSSTAYETLPAHYEAQVMHYMGLLPSVRQADVACLFKQSGGFRIFPVLRDQATIDTMFEILCEWWEKHVVRGETPEPTCEEDCKALWRESRPVVVFASAEASAAVARYREAKAKVAAAEAEAEEAKTEILAFMRDADTLSDPDDPKKRLATWKSRAGSKRTDWKAVAEEAAIPADIIEKHTTTSAGTRVFALAK